MTEMNPFSRRIRRQTAVTLATRWLVIAVGLAAVVAIDDWFGATAYQRSLMIAVVASVIAAAVNRSDVRTKQPVHDLPPKTHLQGEPPPPVVSPPELNLAIQHIQSIRVILEVSSSHDQPVPRAILVNLDLVLKHLRKLNRVATSEHDGSPRPQDLIDCETALASER